MTKVVATNRKARFEYFIEDKFEAGLVLMGSEVKSVRAGRANINDAFIIQKHSELYMLHSHISKYEQAGKESHTEERKRKLLLRKSEINKIISKIQRSGYTAVVLKLYFNEKNKLKAEVGIGKGKQDRDKRHTIKEREWNREKARILKKDD